MEMSYCSTAMRVSVFRVFVLSAYRSRKNVLLFRYMFPRGMTNSMYSEAAWVYVLVTVRFIRSYWKIVPPLRVVPFDRKRCRASGERAKSLIVEREGMVNVVSFSGITGVGTTGMLLGQGRMVLEGDGVGPSGFVEGLLLFCWLLCLSLGISQDSKPMARPDIRRMETARIRRRLVPNK